MCKEIKQILAKQIDKCAGRTGIRIRRRIKGSKPDFGVSKTQLSPPWSTLLHFGFCVKQANKSNNNIYCISY